MRKAVVMVATSLLALTSACSSLDEADPPRDHPAREAARATERTPLDASQLIVFERTAPGADEPDLYAVEPDGAEPMLLSSPGGYPHWSPDVSQLAFLACMNTVATVLSRTPDPPFCTTALALFERDTGDVHWFPFPDPDLLMGCSVWAPSGNRVACGGLSEGDPTRNGLYSIRVSDGKGLTQITRNPGGEDSALTYSPDGEQLLFARSLGGARQALFVTPIRGGQPKRITPWGFTDDWADWSPDGRTIVFGTKGFLYRVSPSGHGLGKIHLQTAEPSSAKTAFDVSFSPNGERILFSLGHPAGIYTARSDGSDVQRLTSSPTEDHHANWGSAPRSPHPSDVDLRKAGMGQDRKR